MTAHVGVLGPLAVEVDGRELRVAAAKQRSLVGLLALHAGEVVSRDEITDLLWPVRPPRSSADLVTGYVSRLRRAGLAIHLAGRGYRLVAATDLQAFEAHVRRGELALALACWRGPVLAELRDHPAGIAVARRRLDVALRFADRAIHWGQFADVVAALEPLIGTEPWHEGLHARLIVALAGTGSRAAALDVHARIRRRLADELGLEPSAELRAAHQYVLRADEEPAALVRAAPPGRKSGETRSSTYLAEISRLCAMAETFSAFGDHDLALDYVHMAITIAARLDPPVFAGTIVLTLGAVCSRRGDHREAVKYYFRALDLAHRAGHTYAKANAHLGLATAHHQLEDTSEAVAHAEAAGSIARAAGFGVLAERSAEVVNCVASASGRDPARCTPR